MRRHRDRAERAAQRQAAGVTHEHCSGRRVEPQKRQPRADDRGAEDRQLAGARDMGNAEIFGIVHAAHEIGDQREGARGDDHRHGRQPVEPVGEVHRIARADDHEGSEDVIEIAQLDAEIVEEGDVEEGVDLPDHDPAGDPGDEEFQQQSHPARDALVARFGNLVVIVEETDQPEPAGDRDAGPDEGIGEVHPQQQ